MTILRLNDGLHYTDASGDEAVAPMVVATTPANLLTDTDAGVPRLKTDNERTLLIKGREFRIVRKITTPIVFRFTSAVPTILLTQTFSLSEGDVEMYSWAAADVTPAGTWGASVPVLRENGTVTDYNSQVAVNSGGTITVNNPNNYREYFRLATPQGGGSRSTGSAAANAERILAAGTFYVQFVGTGVGHWSIVWGELE